MATQIDHEALAISRLATQFRDSTNLINYIKALLSEADTLEQVFQDILNKRWIDTAEGVQLDILGSIVGQPRILVDSVLLSYFGFDPDPGASSFGTIADPSIGGRFRGADEPTTGNRELTDGEYRVFIRARIIKNSIIPTVPATISFFKFLFDIEQVIIVDSNMQYTVQLGKALTANEKVFLLNTDLVPKVAAVGVGYQEFDPDSQFGFIGISASKGFGSVSDSSIGGKFSSTIS